MLTRVVAVVLVVLLGLLQLRLWFSEDGFRGVAQLRNQVSEQRAQNRELTDRNRRLESEVADLKMGFSALEERARSDLGLIGPNESFYIYAGPPDAAQASAGSRR
jgi:cell division protein FtsB